MCPTRILKESKLSEELTLSVSFAARTEEKESKSAFADDGAILLEGGIFVFCLLKSQSRYHVGEAVIWGVNLTDNFRVISKTLNLATVFNRLQLGPIPLFFTLMTCSLQVINVKDNGIGPRTDPWGAPLITCLGTKWWPLMTTRWVLLVRNDCIHSYNWPSIP